MVEEIIENIYKKAQANNCEILIPEDCMVGTDFEGAGKNKNLDEVKDNEIILDIGFNSIKNIQKKIIYHKVEVIMELRQARNTVLTTIMSLLVLSACGDSMGPDAYQREKPLNSFVFIMDLALVAAVSVLEYIVAWGS